MADTTQGSGSSSGPPRHTESCSFCGKNSSDVARLIAGPPGVYICNECVDLCYSIVNEATFATDSSSGPRTIEEVPSPRELYDELQRWVIGQEQAKRTLAVAVHLREQVVVE